MSADNSPGAASDVKRGEVDPPQTHCCRGSGESMFPNTQTLVPTRDCEPPHPTMHHFLPRRFPPPSLAGVPVEYIIDQLRNLAPHYWDKQETADCTIIVPVPRAQGRPMHPSVSTCFPPESSTSIASMYDPSGSGRRATEPILNFLPRISLKLHVDYLSAHSSYLRSLFSGASPLDLFYTTSHPPSPKRSSGRFTIPSNRLPRLMPCSPDHPILYLPVPDPSSFHLLVHWMYFGNTSFIEDCLHKGIIQWEGIARNVEYLGLSTDIKVFLGRWYSRWLHPEHARDGLCDEDSDTAYSDEDGDDDDAPAASDMDGDVDHNDEKEAIRGRTRARPLSFQGPRTPST